MDFRLDSLRLAFNQTRDPHNIN